MEAVSDKHIWTSHSLINIGLDLWKEKKKGHCLLFVIGSQVGLKIGDLISLKWEDLINFKKEGRYGKVELEKNGRIIRLNDTLIGFIEFSADQLNAKKGEYVFRNYKTNNQFTTASLNRDLRNITEKIIKGIKDNFEGVFIGDKSMVEAQASFLGIPIKTKDIELGWARDEVIAKGQTHSSFVWISKLLNHKNTKYTIEFLALEEIEEKPRYNHQEDHLELYEFMNREN